MIRCHKCGYSNQPNAKICIKCRTSLLKEEPYVPVDAGQVNKKTIPMLKQEEEPWDSAPFPPVRQAREGAQTVRRIVPDQRSSYLVALSADEEKELHRIELPGSSVSLDRDKLDPGNSSISRNGHASIYLKDGNWYIENMTALKTTFLQVNQPMRLMDGDVILLGDSLFKFRQG